LFGKERFKEMPEEEENHGVDKRQNLCGEGIRRLRIAQGLTLSQVQSILSSEYGLDRDRTNLGRLERGTRKVSDIELVILAHLFAVSPEHLLLGDVPPDKSQLRELSRAIRKRH